MRHTLISSFRSYPWQHHFICIAPLAGILIFLAAGIGTGDDITLYFKALRPQMPVLTKVMRFISTYCNPAFYAVYAWILWRGIQNRDIRRIRFVLMYAAVQVLVSLLLVNLLKVSIGKPRPMVALGNGDYVPFSPASKYHAFPSGHTSEAVGAAVPLATWHRQALFSLLVGIAVALVGFSRIYLSRHHLSDVVGGMVAGSLVGLLIHYFCSREKT